MGTPEGEGEGAEGELTEETRAECCVSNASIEPPERQLQRAGGSAKGSPRRKPRGAGAGEIKEAEKRKSFNKDELVNRVKCCINVKWDDKGKWSHWASQSGGRRQGSIFN